MFEQNFSSSNTRHPLSPINPLAHPLVCCIISWLESDIYRAMLTQQPFCGGVGYVSLKLLLLLFSYLIDYFNQRPAFISPLGYFSQPQVNSSASTGCAGKQICVVLHHCKLLRAVGMWHMAVQRRRGEHLVNIFQGNSYLRHRPDQNDLVWQSSK